MKKKQLKIFAIVLSASIILTTNSIFAATGSSEGDQNSGAANPATVNKTVGEASNTPESANETTTLRLSLEDALKTIETGNNSLHLTDSKILIYDKQYEQALARQNANNPVVDEDSAKVKRLNYERALWTLENAKHDRETQLKDLKVQVTNQYQSILALQQQVNNLETQLANVDTYIDQLNLQIDLGMAIQSQTYALNAQRSSLEAALKATQNSINSSMISLKRDLGIDLNRKVVLTSDLVAYAEFDDSKFAEQLANAVANDYAIQRYEKDIELTEIEYDIAFYYDNSFAADQLQVSVEDLKATLADLPVTKEVSLRTAYNSLKSLENSIKSANLAIEADKINSDVLQKKIDVGYSSSIEMIELQNKLLNDQYTLLQNINSYMSAVANLQNALEVTAPTK